MDGEQWEDLLRGGGVGIRGIFWEGEGLHRRFGIELSCGW